MKKALLIGNQNYKALEKLCFPEKDVITLKGIFETIGFSVITHFDVTFEVMKKVISDFTNSVNNGDEIVFYFSGHGYHFQGHNYITPIDCLDYYEIKYNNILDPDYEKVANVIDVNSISDDLCINDNGFNVLIIDACRMVTETKLFNDRRIGNLIEIPIDNDNIFFAFATSLGKFALDNSLYAKAISKFILRKSQTIDDLFNCVADFIIKNDKNAEMPCVYKKTNKSYSFVDESNYCYEVEKQYYDELFQIYVQISDVLSERNNIQEFLDKSICKFNKGDIFYPNNLLNQYFEKVITAFNENLGIVYLLLEDEFFTRIDIKHNSIYIEAKFGSGYSFANDNYYDFEKCVEFIRSLQTKSSDIFCYKNKTIILEDKYSKPFFQIINCMNSESLTELIGKPISRISKEDKTIEIKNLLINYIKNKKNILVVGDPHTNKEEFISAFSEYFSEKDKIFVLDEDKNIDIRKGQRCKSSTTFDELECLSIDELYRRMDLLNKENITRVLYQHKAFRNNKEIFKALNRIKNCQFIATYDHDIRIFLTKLEMIKEYDITSNFDLVVLLDNCKATGSIVNSIYEKNNNFDCAIDVEIDYDKLSILNERL